MRRPKTNMPKRPRTASAAVARTSKEAAIRLVRLEFDAARLEMGIAQASDRATAYRDELAANIEQRKGLLRLLHETAELDSTS